MKHIIANSYKTILNDSIHIFIEISPFNMHYRSVAVLVQEISDSARCQKDRATIAEVSKFAYALILH